MTLTWSYFASPASFYRLAGRMSPWFFALAAVLAVAGLYIAFVVAPTDAQQGEVYRVIFIHVPAAWMSMWIYFVMTQRYGDFVLYKPPFKSTTALLWIGPFALVAVGVVVFLFVVRRRRTAEAATVAVPKKRRAELEALLDEKDPR